MATPTSKLKSKWKLFIPPLVILVIVVGGLAAIKTTQKQSQHSDFTVEISVGNSLPEFSLSPLNGPAVPITKLKSKVTLVNFWASWCEACVEEMPSIAQVRQDFHSQGFEVLAINLDENPETMIPKAVKQFNLEFPVFQDVDGQLAELFDVHAIPLSVVIDENRKILLIRSGGQDWNSPSFRTQLKKWLTE